MVCSYTFFVKTQVTSETRALLLQAALHRACADSEPVLHLQLVWAASVLLEVPVALQRRFIPPAHAEILAGAAAAGSLFAELFMIKSLLVFDPDTAAAARRAARERAAGEPSGGMASPRSPRSPRYERSMVRGPCPVTSCYLTCEITVA